MAENPRINDARIDMLRCLERIRRDYGLDDAGVEAVVLGCSAQARAEEGVSHPFRAAHARAFRIFSSVLWMCPADPSGYFGFPTVAA